MGESSTCLVQSFSSFSTPVYTCSKEENPIHMLGESISFGRFMSESLDWKKWSAFSHNRYVEEAENYSNPGSVAATKAYFETHYKVLSESLDWEKWPAFSHNCYVEEAQKYSKPGFVAEKIAYFEVQYKKRAAEKATALIEEANTQANGTFDSETQEGNCTDSSLEERMTDPGTAGEEVLALPLKGREVNSCEELSNKTRAAAKLSHSLDEKKATAAVPPRSGTNCGSKSKKLVGDSAEKKRLTARSLHMSINLSSGSGQTSETASVFEPNRTKKIHSNFVNISKDQHVLSQTSTKASHQASANPPSQGRRTERLQNKSVFGRCYSKCKPFLHFCGLPEICKHKNSPRTPTISTPFRFRTEERAVKRKEFLQRMVEIKSKEEEKVQLQRTPKISLTLPRSPKLLRKACSSTVQDNNYFGNSWKPPISTNNSKRITEKVNRTTRQSVTSLSNTTRENVSPNTQQSEHKKGSLSLCLKNMPS